LNRLRVGSAVLALLLLLVACSVPGRPSGAASSPPGIPDKPAEGGQVRDYQLIAAPVDWPLADGSTVKALAYNGQVPGPPLTARTGDLIKVTFKNDLSQETTVHWHGLKVPNSMDGVPDLTQKPVPPGGSFTYQFLATTPGTYWYHSHVDEVTQVRAGLYGPIVIEPRETTQQIDREETIIVSDFGTMSGSASDTVPGISPPSTAPSAGMPSMMGQGGTSGMGMGQGMMGEPQQPSDHARDFLINGKRFPATPELTVHQGERIRLRLINASASADHFIRLDGHQLTPLATDGHDLPQTAPASDVIQLAPAERVDVLLTADHPGVWALHCLVSDHTAMGMRMTVRYDGQTGGATIDQTDPKTLKIWSPELPARGRQTPAVDKTVDLQLSGNMMGSTHWTINGQSYPDVSPITVKLGQRVRLRITNMSMEAHPMHLHGQPFDVVAVNGRVVEPATKDTLELAPMGSAIVDFKATNPGKWLFHCHNFEHMMNGLATVIQVE
jgi:FtsP/CotA-like multicopper oxidase with cupredoxin domain